VITIMIFMGVLQGKRQNICPENKHDK